MPPGLQAASRQGGRMSNFFITLAVFLITIIGALFAVPYFIDWNGYRGVFEEEATRLLGREVRVGGAVNLHLLPTPYFRFEKVRIADTSVNLQDAFFRSESLAIKLSIPPIFRGVVEANEIELHRPVLRLALDKEDGWNWQSFGQLLGGVAYLPSNIALTSVKIADGVLAVHGVDGAERTRFEGINGELSAPALDGPYRFRGTFGKGRAERELRVATARPEPDGSVRLKATLRSGESGSTFSLDGRLADPMGRAAIAGELTARLPIAGLWHVPPQADGRGDQAEAAFDLKAALRADPAGAMLSDLALAFEQNGRPQLITGELRVLWRDAFALEMSLSSRWLDLDRMAGVGERATPALDAVVPLALAVRDLLPAEGRSRAAIAIDQANIGGDSINNLRLALARTQDRLELEELRLGMPGGSRGELRGTISGLPETPTFDGSFSLRGTSLVRFVNWASANALAVDAKGDGGFGIRSQLSIAPGSVGVRNLIGDLSGTAVQGQVHYRWEGRPELALLLRSPQLDARAFVPAGASMVDMLDVILHGPVQQNAPGSLGAAKGGWRGAQTDTQIRVDAGQLITASRTYRDVVMEMELRAGRLKVSQLRVAGDEGFNLELEGDLDNAAVRPKGILRGIIGAQSPQAIAPLADLLGIPEAFRPSLARAQAMVPLRIAGSMSLGMRTSTSADLVADGEISNAITKLNARFDGGAAGWRSGPLDLTALIEGPNANVIAGLLAPGREHVANDANPQPGRLLLKGNGVPAQGLQALAALDAGDLALSFRGRLAATDSGNSAAGDLELRAADATRLAALAGLAPPLKLAGVPVAGTLKMSVVDGKLAMDNIALKLGNNRLTGQIALGGAGAGRRVEGKLNADELSVPTLLGPLLDQRLGVAGAAESAVSGRQSPWPDEPFDGAMFDAFEGSLSLTAKRLLLAEGIALSEAGIDIGFSSGRLDLTRIEGGCLGGHCSAALRIDRVPAGVELNGSVRVAGGTLQALAGGGNIKSRVSGTIGGEIKFASKGTSPRSVLSVLHGSGTLTLGQARLAMVWPGAITAAAEAALGADADKLPAIVAHALATGLAAGELPLPATVAVEIADGRLSMKPLVLDSAAGRAEGSASLDLRSLNFESEWRLEQRPPAPNEKPALPSVSVSYRGPVAAVGTLEPRIVSDALERELAVRRMERDVEELEKLRKLDEARRREEAERQRRQFEQTPVPAPMPMAPAVPQPRPATPG